MKNIFMSKNDLLRGALVAGAYAALTIVLEPFSYGVVQIRVAEALTVLPILYGEAVWGLFVGCIIANVLGGLGVVDVFFGSAATLIAALGTRYFRNSKLAYLFPIVINALVVGGYLAVIYAVPVAMTMLSIFVSEALVVLTLGVLLVKKVRQLKYK